MKEGTILWLLLALCSAPVGSVQAKEYFAAPWGSDTNTGLSRAAALATVQRGVDALAPGDTLTILPGEYFGGVRRDDLGATGAVTTIRADISGTVVLRGDTPAPEFRKAEGYRFVYVADFDADGHVQVINELDTLTVIEHLPSATGLDSAPGRFHHDPVARKLYLSPPDLASPRDRPYTLSLTGTHGLYLRNPRRVVIEGLTATGFNRNGMAPMRDGSQYSVWGMIIVNGRGCVLRDCQAYLNGRGITINSEAQGSGGNVIERCRAWANASQYGTGDSGGLTICMGRRDVIRDSVAFRNATYGINIRGEAGGSPPRDAAGRYKLDPATRNRMIDNLAWGNACDFKIKTGHAYLHTAEGCAAPGLWSLNDPIRCLMGRFTREHTSDNVSLSQEKDLDPEREFADPIHHDYRLQGGSRFRGSGPDQRDRGPLPYTATIFYLSPTGSDAADGLSLSNAWRTLERAFRGRRAGDTLYMESGVYQGNMEARPGAETTAPLTLRGRGRSEVLVKGGLTVRGSAALCMERLSFNGPVRLTGSRRVAIDNCTFAGAGGGLHVRSAGDLRVAHSLFAGTPLVLEATDNSVLSGNLHAHQGRAAVQVDAPEHVRYADYNGYQEEALCWSVAGQIWSLDDVRRNGQEIHAHIGTPEITLDRGIARLSNAREFVARGPHGTSLGLHSFLMPEAREALQLVGPWVHSVSETTANIEWRTSRPVAAVSVTWGATGALNQAATRDAGRNGSFSLTGLQPDTPYTCRIAFKEPLARRAPEDLLETTSNSVTFSFRTPAQAHAPRKYWVAPDGDDTASGESRDRAWRTIAHAAGQVRPGDTVLIAGGIYREAVRLRATGEHGRPITFKAAPGEKVMLDGAERTLDFAFLAADKSHLRFDGFYLSGFDYGSDAMPWSAPPRSDRHNGAFVLYESHDVQITRCFNDGRGAGASPGLVHARHCADLLIQNNVMLNCMGRLEIFWNSPRAQVINNVFLRNFIAHTSIHTRGQRIREDRDRCRLEHNIFSDNLTKKSHAALLEGNAVTRDNCFFLRTPPGERVWHPGNRESFADFLRRLPDGDATLVADPRFQGALWLERVNRDGTPAFPADRLIMKPDLDFPDLFATHVDVVKRGIGLQPEAFADLRTREAAGQTDDSAEGKLLEKQGGPAKRAPGPSPE